MLIARKFSLRPDRLVLYNEITPDCNTIKETINTNSNNSSTNKFKIRNNNNNRNNQIQYDAFQNIESVKLYDIIPKVIETIPIKKILIKKYHNFRISHNANKTMKEKINWLYYLSKNRYKQTYSGKHIYNYKLSFITLTLPSNQIHTTSFITKHIFNQFLTEIRSRSKMKNYVWRLEFQKNKNVHYHLVTDSYLDYFFIQKIWNRIINKFGYVDVYTKKFNNLNLSQYNKITNNNNKIDFEIIKSRYLKGIKSKWKEPNTVDVKSVINRKSISNYIAKYFSKNSTDENSCNPLDNVNNSFSLRLWFCSRTLSKLKSIKDYFENVNYNISYVIEKCSKYKYIHHKYVTVVYYKIVSYSNRFARFLDKLLRNYANDLGYVSSS